MEMLDTIFNICAAIAMVSLTFTVFVMCVVVIIAIWNACRGD